MKKNLLLLLLIFTGVLFQVSCSDDNFDDEDRITTYGIRHDKTLASYEAIAASTSDEYPDFESVLFFGYSLDGSDSEEYVATGTLVAENWILTAGHNFYVADEQDEPALPSGIIVKTGNDPNNPTQSYEVAEIVFHPTWISDNRDFLSANDLALVRLKTPITNLPIIELFKNSNEEIGSITWFAGFGDYSETEGQNPDLFSKKHAIKNILDRKVAGINTSKGGVTYSGGLLAFDFDDPDGTINTLGDGTINSDEQILTTGTSATGALDYEGTTVQGDSGGPLFVKDGDIWKVAGVLSGGADSPFEGHRDGSYGDISIFIRVSQSADWIESIINN